MGGRGNELLGNEKIYEGWRCKFMLIYEVLSYVLKMMKKKC